MTGLSQHLCSASTLLCYARAVPLWIVALLGLALIPIRAYIARHLNGFQRKKTPA